MNGTLSTVIICVILAFIAVFSLRGYIQKLTNGCCGAGGDEVKRVRPGDRDLSHYSHTYKLGVEGMSCKNCAMRVENAFNEREGCCAEVDLKQNSAVVHTKDTLSESELRAVVQKAGYQVTSLETVS